MSEYHEPESELEAFDRDLHRALTSLKEEIEAVDWYHQRYVTASDGSLKKILKHNRDEEIEHAVMAIEWLRRKMPEFDEKLKTYLFTTDEIVEIEEKEEQGKDGKTTTGEAINSFSRNLNIGSLKNK